jgi:glutamate 5-kinase
MDSPQNLPHTSNPPDGRQQILQFTDTWVVKVGSRVLTGSDGRLDRKQIEQLAGQLIDIRRAGYRVILVSSGAVASGMGRLGLTSRPTDLAQLQAVAAIGQAHLIQVYEETLSQSEYPAAQVLLTAEDLDDRTRYLNVRNTLLSLLNFNALPIINENDTVAVDELMTTFGDNDRLAAMVAGLFPRAMLVILSDVKGVYDRDPADSQAQLLNTIPVIDDSTFQLVRDRKTGLSKGGMASKLRAAQFVTSSGQPVIIAGGKIPGILNALLRGENQGTLFLPQQKGMTPRKRWIGFSAQCSGRLVIDDGAAKALQSGGKSLLPIGIQDVHGSFAKGDVVAIINKTGEEFARGLSNYSAAEVRQIRGCKSPRIAEILGHCPYEEVIHYDNMALVGTRPT